VYAIALSLLKDLALLDFPIVEYRCGQPSPYERGVIGTTMMDDFDT
jgi:hypothetical protein